MEINSYKLKEVYIGFLLIWNVLQGAQVFVSSFAAC